MLRAGIELEFYVRFPEKMRDQFSQKHGSTNSGDLFLVMEKLNWSRETVAGILHAAGLDSKNVNTFETVNYQNWSVIHESTVSDRKVSDDWFGIEIVSPILDTSTESLHKIRLVFQALTESGVEIMIDPRYCGTHVHISPTQPGWTFLAVQRLSIAIIHYENAMEKIVHADRLILPAEMWLHSNYKSVIDCMGLSDNREGALAAIADMKYEKYETLKILGWRMACEPGLVPPEMMKVADYRPGKHFKWGFESLFDPNKMTIEHRLPQGSATAEEAIGWFLFTTGFAEAAMNLECESTKLPAELKKKTLRQFVEEGVKLSGYDDPNVLNLLKPVFEKKSS